MAKPKCSCGHWKSCHAKRLKEGSVGHCQRADCNCNAYNPNGMTDYTFPDVHPDAATIFGTRENNWMPTDAVELSSSISAAISPEYPLDLLQRIYCLLRLNKEPEDLETRCRAGLEPELAGTVTRITLTEPPAGFGR